MLVPYTMGVAAKRTRTKTRRRTRYAYSLIPATFVCCDEANTCMLRIFRDLDQAKTDLQSPKYLEAYKKSKAAEDLPGSGLWYCVECSRWFDTEGTLSAHQRGKPHKRRFVTPIEAARSTLADNRVKGQAAGRRAVHSKGGRGCGWSPD